LQKDGPTNAKNGAEYDHWLLFFTDNTDWVPDNETNRNDTPHIAILGKHQVLDGLFQRNSLFRFPVFVVQTTVSQSSIYGTDAKGIAKALFHAGDGKENCVEEAISDTIGFQ
jgi:hypothetical protein